MIDFVTFVHVLCLAFGLGIVTGTVLFVLFEAVNAFEE